MLRTIAGECVRLPRMNAPGVEGVIKLPVGYPWANGGQVNLFFPQKTEVFSVNWFSILKVPADHEVLIALGVYDPKTGAMPLDLGRALHESRGISGKPECSVVAWVHHFRPGSVVVPAGHVLGIWAVGGLVPSGERFSGNPLEIQTKVEVADTAGVVEDWPKTQPAAADGMSFVSTEAEAVTPQLPAFMADWLAGRAKKRRKKATGKTV